MQLMMMRQLCGGRHVRATAVRAARHRPSASAFAVADRFRPPPQRWLTSGACNDSSSSQPENTPEVPKNPLLQSIARDAAALQRLYDLFSSNPAALAMIEACTQHIAECHARDCLVYVTGVGKSGIVAQRLASTLASISIRSQWIHGSEWVHGELGNLRHEDVVIILSHSGKTSELLSLPSRFQAAECAVVAITGDADSPLSVSSNVGIAAPADDHAHCPVPSRSIIVQESICNAIVEHLVHRLGERAAEFRCNHPGGALGDEFAQKRPCCDNPKSAE